MRIVVQRICPGQLTIERDRPLTVISNALRIVYSRRLTISHTFEYNNVSVTPLYSLPIGQFIIRAEITILTAFDGSGAALSIGKSATYNDVMASADNLPNFVGTYEVAPQYEQLALTPISLKIVPGSGATTGEGLVVLTLSEL